jgi:hypothetical protein
VDEGQPEYEIIFERRTRPDIDLDTLAQSAILPKIQEAMSFVLGLKNASLDDPVAKMSDEALDRLRNPPQTPLRIESPGIRHSISTYLALEHASQDAYHRIYRSTLRNFPGAAALDDIQSFRNVEKIIATYTGVESLEHDMCPNSCLAFTGPFAPLIVCPICSSSHWDQARLHASNGHEKVATKKFVTIPLGPQLQALYRNPESACDM